MEKKSHIYYIYHLVDTIFYIVLLYYLFITFSFSPSIIPKTIPLIYFILLTIDITFVKSFTYAYIIVRVSIIALNIYLYNRYFIYYSIAFIPLAYYIALFIMLILVIINLRAINITKRVNESKEIGNMKEAKIYLDKLYKYIPDKLYYYSTLSIIYLVEKKFNFNEDYEAIKSILEDNQIKNLNNHDKYMLIPIVHFYADVHYNNGNYSEAIIYYKKVNCLTYKYRNKELREVYLKSLFLICNCYFAIEDTKKFLHFYKKCRRICYGLGFDAHENITDYFYAIVMYEQKNYDKSEEVLVRLLNNHCFSINELKIYKYLVMIYSYKNLTEKVWDYLIKATDKQYNFIEHYNIDPDILTETQKKLLFKLIVEKTVNEDYTVEIYSSLIYLLFLINEDKKAYEYISKMEIQFGEDINYFYWKIVYYMRNRSWKKAQELYKSICTKDPNFFENYNWIEVNMDNNKIKKILDDKS